MAELPKNIRKVGGEMVAARSPFTRRVLLPTEADLCNALGITEEEYFQFLEGVAAKVKEQPEAYGLVPGIFAGPGAGALALYQTVGGATTLTFLGQVAVGVALTAASVLLAPKPPSQRQGTQERTADIGGTKKFAPQFSFNSVQDLANLGDLIPLVFANRSENPEGGIRVNSQLLWSQMVSLGRYQQLKILALFSLGEIAVRPDWKGYAIGDLLIENYHSDKIYTLNYGGIEGTNIPFLRAGGPIPDDTVFKVDNLRHFSGTRNPTTQATFGLSNPMPNATWYRLPYQLVRTQTDISDKDLRPAGRITLKKRRKLLGDWPMGAGFISGGTAEQKRGEKEVPVGTQLAYQIVGSSLNDENGAPLPYSGIAYVQDAPEGDDLTSHPHGLDDVNAATKTVRETTDSYLAIGEQYMAGSALVSCTSIHEKDMLPGEPWDGTEIRGIHFKVIEPGIYEAVPNAELATHLSNPRWERPAIGFPKAPYFEVQSEDRNKFYYEQDHVDIFNPNSRYALQKVSLGTISNNRKCHITEIGIKSKVFKQIQFANVNSKPTEEELYKIYDNKSSLQLGNINKYIVRYSFFKLQVRAIGEDNWKWLKPHEDITAHTGLFCVKGNTPEFQYNYIRIDQPTFGQYEYRFFPWPGAAVIKEVEAYEASQRPTPVNAIVLNSNGSRDPLDIRSFYCNGFTVKFAGEKFHRLSKETLSNSEWNLGAPSYVKLIARTSRVVGFSSNQQGYPASEGYSISNLPQSFTRVTRNVFPDKFYYPPNHGGYVNGSGANGTVIAAFQNHPAPGLTTWSLFINAADVTPHIENYYDGNGRWTAPAHNNYQGSDPQQVRFHYTTLPSDGSRGGKFSATTYKINHPGSTTKLYGVKKDEQLDLAETNATKNNEEVSVDTNPGDPGAGLKVRLTTYVVGTGSSQKYFAYWTLAEPGNNYKDGQEVFISESRSGLNQKIRFNVNLSSTDPVFSDEILDELNPYDAAADMWQYEGDRSSHLDGPEHQITYCNEIVRTDKDSTTTIEPEGSPATYENLAYAGLRINSSKEWTNFSQFSAYFKQGIKATSLIDGTKKAINLFPEIAYALLTDKTLGAGAVISESSVDKDNMEIAAKFCKANKFFWDGMISSRVNLREFIYQQALYCLLDFTIIGGKFSLFPAVPYNSDFTINLEGKPKIKAMFTDGNISDLSVSFLSPEDRQAFKANVLYREEEENGFPEIKSAVVRLFGTNHVDDPLETFDLSGFCTNRISALWFARYTLALRKHLDHTISFKTAPHYINGVRPGDYIRVFSTTQHVQRFNNGAILDDGTVVSKDTISGSKTFYYWNPSTIVAGEIMPVTEATANFSSPLPSPYRGSLFTIKESEASDQCYKVESITFGDDGLVELTGSYAELTADGKLAMLQNWSNVGSPVFYEED